MAKIKFGHFHQNTKFNGSDIAPEGRTPPPPCSDKVRSLELFFFDGFPNVPNRALVMADGCSCLQD